METIKVALSIPKPLARWNLTREKFFDILGYLAIVLIQGATMPSLLAFIINGQGELPPLVMTLMVWAGLGLYLARSFDRRDMVAIVSNSIGFMLQSVMLAVITLA